ncbi:MAG: hypothetical protein OXG19_09395 [Chloroflexi bacterium]|nr:hypothetical protein [Chloroflexota bacterium]
MPDYPYVPQWLVEGTTVWHYVNRPLPSIDEQRAAYTNLLDLAQYETGGLVGPGSRSQDTIGIPYLLEINEREALLDFWRILGSDAPDVTTWQAAFARAFGLTPAEFYTYFWERRRALFTQFHGRVAAAAESPPPDLFVVATSVDLVIDERYPLQHVAAVGDDGTFTLNLPKGQAHTVALADGNSDCRLPMHVDRLAAWTTAPLTIASDREMVAGLDLALPAGFCQTTVTLTLPRKQAADATLHDLAVSICDAEGAGCVAAKRSSGAYVATIPVPGAYVVSLDRERRSCPVYLSDDGIAADREQAQRYHLGSGSHAIAVTEEQLNGVCTLVVQGRLLGRSSDWYDRHQVTLYEEPDEQGRAYGWKARIGSDGTFVATLPKAGRYRLSISVPHPTGDIARGCHIDSDYAAQWQERHTSTGLEQGYFPVLSSQETSLTWLVDPDACRWLVEGRITDPDLQPHANLRFTLCWEMTERGSRCVGPTTNESGHFSVLAPTGGPQALRFNPWGDCASGARNEFPLHFSVDSADVKGLHWILPTDPCAP